jgi:hypothetical protein
LLCVVFIVWWPFTATGCIFSFHFSLLESPSKQWVIVLPKRSSAAESCTPPHLVLFSVGCCVVSANGGRLKLMPYPSFCFFRCPIRRPKRQEQSSQRVPPRSRLITNASPPASADLRLVVVPIDKTAAIQDLCSALPQFFDVCHWGAPSPNQGIPPQRARSRAPTAEATAWRRRRLEQMRS